MKILKYIIFSLFFTISLNGGEIIESLPKRERAEMNIEVTKILTEKILASHDEEFKTITLDFKSTTIDQSLYEIFLFEDLNTLPSYSVSNGKARVGNVIKNGAKLRAGSRITSGKLTYFLDRAKSNSTLNIQYDEKPNKIYIGVLNKSTSSVAKIFNVEYDTPTLFSNAVPTITSNYKPGSQYILDNEDLQENPDEGYYLFDLGNIKSVISNYAPGNGGTNIDIIPGVTIGQYNQIFNSSSTNTTYSSVGFNPPKIKVGSYDIEIRSHFYSIGFSQSPLMHSIDYSYRNNTKGIAYNVNRNNSTSTTLTLQTMPRISLPKEVISVFRSVSSDNNLFEYSSANNYFNFVVAKRDRSISPNKITLISDIKPFSGQYPFPKLGIKKDYAEFSGKIEFSDFKNPSLTFDGSSILTSSGAVSNFVSNKETNLSSKSQNRLLRSLLFKSSVSASGTNGNSVTELISGAIDGDGINNGGNSTTPLSFKVINGSNWAKVQISYSTGVPTFTLVDYYPKSSDTKNSFTFCVEHKEASSLVRRKYNITLLTPDTNKLRVDTNTVPDSSTYDDIDRKPMVYGYAVFSGGNLKATLSNYIDGYFPAFTIGNAKIENRISAQIAEFNGLALTYNDYKFNSRIHFYTVDNPITDKNGFYAVNTHASGLSKEIITGKHLSSDNKNLVVSTALRLNIPEKNIIEMRKDIEEESITLTPEAKDYNVITTTIGTHNSDKTLFTVDSTTTPNIKYKYPTIVFQKQQPTKPASITLNTSYIKGSKISFNLDGTHTSSTPGVTSASLPPGLSFGGSYGIYQGESKIGDSITTNGVDKYTSAGDTTETHKFTLKDTLGNDVKISLKHNVNGLIDFSLDEWSTDAEADFKIVYYEGSGLMRQTTNVKLITPIIASEISKGVLDFGIILKGSNRDYSAETKVIITEHSGHDVSLVISNADNKVTLSNGSSSNLVADVKIDSGTKNENNKVFTLTGDISIDSVNKSTGEGTHTGTVNLNMTIKPITSIKLSN